MFKGYKLVKESVRHYPLLLLELTDKKLIAYADSFLKYDTGFEIECSKKAGLTNKGFNDYFNQIPNIISVNNDDAEQRFRIPTGIKGLVCLFEICKKLKEYSELNPASGIHYHIDFTKDAYLYKKRKHNDYWNSGVEKQCKEFIKENNDWILKSLESWNYKGKYNDWACTTFKTAVRFHEGYGTVEFRIGEMSFDYEVLVKRIIHCQNISTKIKKNLKEYFKPTKVEEIKKVKANRYAEAC